MKGGRIRGQGTYGCVFQPALLCRGVGEGVKKVLADPTKVGKITSVEDAENELAIARYLVKLPDASKYTVFAEPQECVPRARSKQEDPDIRLCEFTKDMDLQTTTQIMMPWGGTPMNRINLNPPSFDFFRFMEETLAAGAFLTLNDICHMDIGGHNLLFHNDRVPRIIDFGFAFRPSTLELSDLKSRWRIIAYDHDTETPEVTLMLGAFKGIPPSTVIQRLQRAKPAVQRLVSLCDVVPSEWATDLNQWAKESQSFQQNDWLSCWKLYWPGFDAWALSTVLLEILEIQMAIPSFIQSSIWKERGETVKSVLKHLCGGHPAFRKDAVEALHMFTNGSHPLVSAGSAGSDWISEKNAKRPLV